MKEFLSRLSLNQKVGLGFGAVYVLVGLAGFAVTGGSGFASTEGPRLLFFEVNPLHNLVHLAVGGLLAGAAYSDARSSQLANAVVGGVYFVVGLFGLFAIGTAANIVALNQPDNALHFVSALVLVGVGLLPFARRVPVAWAGSVRQVGKASSAPRRGETFEPGQDVPRSGTYRCSCNEFAVFVRSGGVFPECPVGEGHRYTLTSLAGSSRRSA